MSLKTVEKSYDKLAVYAKKRSKLQKDFDDKCRKQYGFLYDEIDFSVDPCRPQLQLKDEDEIIDTLDYGTVSLSFYNFNTMMMKAKHILITKNVKRLP